MSVMQELLIVNVNERNCLEQCCQRANAVFVNSAYSLQVYCVEISSIDILSNC